MARASPALSALPTPRAPSRSGSGRPPAVGTPPGCGGFPLIDDDDPATGGLDRFEHDVLTWHLTRDVTAPVVGEDPRPHALRRHGFQPLAGDLVQHASGLWLTAPLSTALHCCSLLSFEAAVCVMDDGLHRELFTAADLDRALDLRAGLPGLVRQRAVAAAADGRAEAASETLLRLILAPHWPELEPQVTVYDERTYPVRRYDLGDRTIRLGVESDGKRGHAGDRMVAKDERKDRRAGRYGWRTERASWFEIRREQEQLRSRVLGARDRLRSRAA